MQSYICDKCSREQSGGHLQAMPSGWSTVYCNGYIAGTGKNVGFHVHVCKDCIAALPEEAKTKEGIEEYIRDIVKDIIRET